MKNVLILFGVTGDLAKLKILPAIEMLNQSIYNGNKIEIRGVGRSDVDVGLMNQYNFQYFKTGYLNLNDIFRNIESDDNVLCVLSIPPSSYLNIISQISIQSKRIEKKFKIFVEKPIGFDLDSAKEFIQAIKQYDLEYFFNDHYLGKENVWDMEKLINPHIHNKNGEINHITNVELNLLETQGVEMRAGFYDKVGVINDIFQNHALQTLAILFSKHCNISKAKVLEIFSDENYTRIVKFEVKQYEGYLSLEGVAENSKTPTEMHLEWEINFPNIPQIRVFVNLGKKQKVGRANLQIKFEDNTEEDISLATKGKAYIRQIDKALNSYHNFFVSEEEILLQWKCVENLTK